MRAALVGAALVMGVTGLAHAADPAAPVSAPATTFVLARQSAFALQQGVFNAMKATIDAGGSVKPLEVGANGLVKWGTTMAAMFPAGTDVPPTHALGTVWSDNAGFVKAADNFTQAATKLLAAAQADDKAAFAAQFTETGKTCGACHREYRQR